jgi:hypothetical protein
MSTDRTKLWTSVGLLIVAAGVLIGTRDWSDVSGPVAADQSYYYDVERGVLFTADYGLKMPVAHPDHSGAEPSGVLAHVFSCGDCADEAQRFVGYIEYRDPKPMSPDPVRVADVPADGKPPRWVGGDDAQVIRDAAAGRCDGAKPTPCHPQ